MRGLTLVFRTCLNLDFIRIVDSRVPSSLSCLNDLIPLPCRYR